tara:strand:- start:124 stop:255 length:132 start_codon:yes stop_codon:yes gene_type:complete
LVPNYLNHLFKRIRTYMKKLLEYSFNSKAFDEFLIEDEKFIYK